VKQTDISSTGHAIECRIYAEDASNDFAPSTGEIVMLQIPDGAGTRFDGAIRQGLEITPYYDPMLGKLICWAKDRDSALNRSERALREFYIGGIETTIQFCRSVVRHPVFRKGTYDTHFYTKFREELHADLAASTDEVLLVAGGSLFHHQNQIKHSSNASASTTKARSNWVSAQLGRND
nr:acetyl-CoA carboxylase biotin carboxylase subunit [FCB group bacterium]